MNQYIRAINAEIKWCEEHKSFAINLHVKETPEKCKGFIEGLKQAKRLIRRVDKEVAND